jgi:hypothetical protein
MSFGSTLEVCIFHPIVSVMTDLVTFRNSTLEGVVSTYQFLSNRMILPTLLTLLMAGRAAAQLPQTNSAAAPGYGRCDRLPPSSWPEIVSDKSDCAGSPKADCGEDQYATVGSWVTLSGKASTPADRIGFRWIQLSGPRPKSINEDGERLMFFPTAEGTYEFALVVAEGSRISVPDFVTVAVNADRTSDTTQRQPASQPSLDRLAMQCASQLDDQSAANRLAPAFAHVATRMDLYESYEDVLQGISSCLQPLLPTEPDQRSQWEGRLFLPLTDALIREIRPTGLDLSRPEGIVQPLSSLQKKSMSESYRLIAKGLLLGKTPSEKKPRRVPLTTSELGRERSSR